MQLKKVAITRTVTLTLAAVSLAVVVSGCVAKHLAFRPNDPRMTPEAKAQSIPLFLPRTVLDFRCTAVRQTIEPSVLYAQAAKKDAGYTKEAVEKAAQRLEIHLNTNPAPVQTYWVRDPALTVRGERDPDALFLIQLDGGMFTHTEFSAQFTADGVPSLVSSTIENKGFEFAMKSIEVAAIIAGKAVGAALKFGPTEVTPQGATSLLESVEQRILTVRATREACITNTALLGQVNDQVLSYLDKLEASLAAYFEGKSTEKTFPLVFTLCPPTNYTAEITLFTFGTNGGFELPRDSQWVRTSVLPSELQGPGKRSERLVVRLSEPAKAEAEALKALAAAKAEERGLPYRIPARTFVQAVLGGDGRAEVLAHGEVLMAQWGLITHLPPKVGSPGSTFKSVYYTETGTLKELTVSGTPLSPEPLDSLGKAAGSVTDALNAKAAKDDELNQLKRQGDMLEQKIRIKDLQDKLKAP